MFKRMVLTTVVVVACVALAGARPAVSVTALLKDGSTVKGEFLTDKVKGTTIFAKELVLDGHAGGIPGKKQGGENKSGCILMQSNV